MRFLVTGASGFIGSNLAHELERKGHEVVGLCKMDPGAMDNLKGFKGRFVQGDIRTFDYASLGKFDAIFHQAAITDTTVMDKELMVSTNITAFEKILRYAHDTGCGKVVYASSAATYGKGKVPMRETDTPAPANISGMGLSYDDYMKHLGKSEAEMREEFRSDAEKRVKMELLIAEIAKAEKLEPNAEETEKQVEEIMRGYPGADKERAKAYVEQIQINEQVFKLLEGK
jgi:hypothetical protein